MEGFLIQLGIQILPAIGLVLVGLATWGIALLKKKIDNEIAKNALEEVNHIVAAVVGQISQTTAEAFKSAAPDGKLTDAQKGILKKTAMQQINGLLGKELFTGTAKIVTDFQSYLSRKIEEQVLQQKK